MTCNAVRKAIWQILTGIVALINTWWARDRRPREHITSEIFRPIASLSAKLDSTDKRLRSRKRNAFKTAGGDLLRELQFFFRENKKFTFPATKFLIEPTLYQSRRGQIFIRGCTRMARALSPFESNILLIDIELIVSRGLRITEIPTVSTADNYNVITGHPERENFSAPRLNTSEPGRLARMAIANNQIYFADLLNRRAG